jgi:orotidine-5'-phosphate decarboxylase
LPLDGLNTRDAAKERVKTLSPYVGLFKTGFEGFTRFGPRLVEDVQENGSQVFLDLKYHDIPETVKNASRAALEHLVWMFNMHASGGVEMMRASSDAIAKGLEEALAKNKVTARPYLVGVTVLTSIGPAEYLDINRPLVPKLSKEELRPFYGMKTGDKDKQTAFAELLIQKGYGNLTTTSDRGMHCNAVEQEVLNLAQMSNEAGLDGIVCSAADLYAVKPHLPGGFKYITPGIQGTKTPAGDDQKRVFSPGKAVRDGSSILVVGRAITGDKKNPMTPEQQQQAAYDILQDMAIGLSETCLLPKSTAP